jgi:hypothetical protein
MLDTSGYLIGPTRGGEPSIPSHSRGTFRLISSLSLGDSCKSLSYSRADGGWRVPSTRRRSLQVRRLSLSGTTDFCAYPDSLTDLLRRWISVGVLARFPLFEFSDVLLGVNRGGGPTRRFSALTGRRLGDRDASGLADQLLPRCPENRARGPERRLPPVPLRPTDLVGSSPTRRSGQSGGGQYPGSLPAVRWGSGRMRIDAHAHPGPRCTGTLPFRPSSGRDKLA